MAVRGRQADGVAVSGGGPSGTADGAAPGPGGHGLGSGTEPAVGGLVARDNPGGPHRGNDGLSGRPGSGRGGPIAKEIFDKEQNP